MVAEGRLVLSRPGCCPTVQLGALCDWGCGPSTSYSSGDSAFGSCSERAPKRQAAQHFTFSLLPESHPSALLTDSQVRPATYKSRPQQQRRHVLSTLGSISISLADTLPNKRGRRKARQQGVSFEPSVLCPSLSVNQYDAAVPSCSSAVTQRSCQSNSAESISLASFQLPGRDTMHRQQQSFASLSLAHGRPMQHHKHHSAASDAPASVASQAGSRHSPVMVLAQNPAGTLEAGTADDILPNDGGASITAAGDKLRASALKLPRQLRRLLAGALAGALSKTTIAPLETIRMQVMGNKGTVMESIARTWGRKGALGFFSGNSADILRVMPSKAIELAAFDAYKKLLSREDEEGRLMRPGPLLTGLAGAAAGATSTVGLYPLETLRTRLAMGDYDNMLHAVKAVTAEEGFMAFYQGIQASLIGILPYAAIRLGVYDGLKWSHRKYTKREHIPPVPTMLYGAFAGLISASATFPVEVVRRRMMVGTAKGGTLAALTSIAQQEGWRSLYKGIGLTWAKQAPQYAVTFLAYDWLKELLEV